MGDQEKTGQAVEGTPPGELPGETEHMPMVPYRVLYAGIPFYSDPECKNKVQDATIAILEALEADGTYPELDVVPTRKKYEPGQIITWTLNNKKFWEESWYQNPETGQIESAWTLHVEFTGELISQRTLELNRKILQEIDAKRAARANQGHSTPRVN